MPSRSAVSFAGGGDLLRVRDALIVLGCEVWIGQHLVEEVAYNLEGMAARIAQHEYDHLDGKLMLDRTTPDARREAMAALRPRLVLR